MIVRLMALLLPESHRADFRIWARCIMATKTMYHQVHIRIDPATAAVLRTAQRVVALDDRMNAASLAPTPLPVDVWEFCDLVNLMLWFD